MELLHQGHRNLGKLLATGQLTSYGSGTGVDDGALRRGIVKSYTVLTLGQYSGTTNITINSKTDVHANACVFDNNTGLMWSRTASASVGPTSNGLLPWTTTGADATAEGIFPYVAAGNAAGLAGYSDWRVPNDAELQSLRVMRNITPYTAVPDMTVFPSWAYATSFWCSVTHPGNVSYAIYVGFSAGAIGGNWKTTTYYAALVRGG